MKVGELASYFQGGKHRSTVQMSPDEIDDFLAGVEAHAAFGSMRTDGSIHLVQMGFAYLDGYVVIETKRRSQRVLNVQRNPQCALLVASGETYADIRGVQIAGHGEIIEDNDYVCRTVAGILDRHPQHQVTATDSDSIKRIAHNRVSIRIHPTRVTSWDHRKLAGPMAGSNS